MLTAAWRPRPSMLGPAFAAAVALGACAKIEAPPGAPPDLEPPHLVSATPESLAVLRGFSGEVAFRFDEVISEGGSPSQGTGTSDLERLIILSPTTRPPEVRWRRDRITVRPREGWQPDRVYRVQLLPGVSDLRNNRATDGGAVVTFTTGAPRPTTRLSGLVWDWVGGRAAPAALVDAVHQPDSLVYRALADSSGRFDLGPLPAGAYLIYGVLDQNHNLVRDGRESFDSVRIGSGRTDVGTLWTFPHDTVGPRIQSITVLDSASATIQFSQPLDPAQYLAASAVKVVRLPDSTAVAVRSLLTPSVDDSTYRRRADSTPPARDSVIPAPRRDTISAPGKAGAAPGRARADTVPARPALVDRLIVRIAGKWVAGGRYSVVIHGVRNVNGVAADAVGGLVLPAAAPEPPAPVTPASGSAGSARADSVRVPRPPPPDSTAGRKKRP